MAKTKTSQNNVLANLKYSVVSVLGCLIAVFAPLLNLEIFTQLRLYDYSWSSQFFLAYSIILPSLIYALAALVLAYGASFFWNIRRERIIQVAAGAAIINIVVAAVVISLIRASQENPMVNALSWASLLLLGLYYAVGLKWLEAPVKK